VGPYAGSMYSKFLLLFRLCYLFLFFFKWCWIGLCALIVYQTWLFLLFVHQELVRIWETSEASWFISFLKYKYWK
jgi:hypothetical protein